MEPAGDRLRIETDVGERHRASTVSVPAVGYEPPSFVPLGVEARHLNGDAEKCGAGGERYLVLEHLCRKPISCSSTS